jgi:nicotinic acid mononucleotide adenylyltransferase
VAFYSGAFCPPTVAHEAVARAAEREADAVVFVLPEEFPHKEYGAVRLEARAEMLLAMGEWGVAVSRKGLYFDIAAEMAEALPGREIFIVVGEDAARRIVEWDYGDGGEYLREHLGRWRLLAVRRGARWEGVEGMRWLDIGPEYAGVSSSEVRRRLAAGEEWRAMVPESLWGFVERSGMG